MKKSAEETLKYIETKMLLIQGQEAITFIRVKTTLETTKFIFGYLPPDWEIDYFISMCKEMAGNIPNKIENLSLDFSLLTVGEFLEDFKNTEKEHGILENLRKDYAKEQSDL